MSDPINMPTQNGDARLKCGGCRWFVTGFEGKTCQITRQVVADTRACVEFQPYKPSPFANIEKDKYVLEMRKTMLVWTEQTIKQYDRDIRAFKIVSNKAPLKDAMSYVEDEKLAELGQMFEECQAAQERLLDLRFNINDKCQELQSFAKDVQAYLFSAYQDYVQVLKNESERAAFYRAAAPELFRAVDKMENLKTKIELTHETLKNAHWALRGKLDAVLELWKARVASMNMGRESRTSG
jgi:flagellar biosynthesis chaperone FliJ